VERDRHTAAALGLILAAVAVAVWAVLVPGAASSLALVVAAAVAPIGVALAVGRRLGSTGVEIRAAAGGAIVGPVVAIASHALVGAFATAFILGFAEAGEELLEALGADPSLGDLLASPWVVLLMVEAVVVAPLTEEAGKALGASWFGRPTTRRQAFTAGVAAGAGFAVVENILYAGLAAAFGGPWQAVVLARILGSAVHPLASGLVVLGVQDRREGGGTVAMLRGYGAGVGIHALWNGCLVVLTVAATTLGDGAAFEGVQLAFSAALGAVFGAALWITAGRVAGEDEAAAPAWSTPALAGWIVLTASLLVPVAVIVLAFPSFWRGS
jgi:RsiW-degrading membrane proteinase PrsW (M82 family)